VATRYHTNAIRAVPEVEALVVVDTDAARARLVAETCPFARWTTDYTELCGKIDLAIVTLPNALHEPVCTRLLESGVNVICEKPLARTVAECQRMIAAADAGRALLIAGHNRRFRKNVQQARHLLGQGYIGAIVEVEAEEGSRADWPRSAAYFDPQQSGGGALIDVGIHSIDLIRYLVGEFSRVEYRGNQTATTVESEAEVTFELEGGVRGHLLCSRDRELRQRIRFVGTKGSLVLELWGSGLHLSGRGKAFRHFPEIPIVAKRRAMDGAFVDQLLNAVRAIRGEEPPLVDGPAGLRAVEVVQWAYQGARPPGFPEAGVREKDRRSTSHETLG
jgi:predicted dehydrogenase